MAKTAVYECGAGNWTADGITTDCLLYFPPQGADEMIQFEDDSSSWLQETCPGIFRSALAPERYPKAKNKTHAEMTESDRCESSKYSLSEESEYRVVARSVIDSIAGIERRRLLDLACRGCLRYLGSSAEGGR